MINKVMFKGRSDYFTLGEHFLDKEEVDIIQNSLKTFPLEDITVGDAGELNNCQVGRLMEDHPEKFPSKVNIDLSEPILKIFQQKKAVKFFESYLPKNEGQTIRRCQFNLLKEGCFVGRHLDIDSNPNYQIACVLQLGETFEGGEFVVYPSKDCKEDDVQTINPEYGSITISKCTVEHSVKTVIKGTRTSFVIFISTYAGKNKRRKETN